QSALRAELEAGQEKVDAEVAALAARLTEAQLAWSPPEGGWGIGQVFEHLALAGESYVAPFEKLMARGTPLAEGDPEWRPAFWGGWLTRSLAKEGNKLPAPKVYKAGPSARPGVIAAFQENERQVADYRSRLAAFDWRHTRITSPAMALIRYNLGDAFSILV